MSRMNVEQEADLLPEVALTFHRDFSFKKPGDVILRTDDNQLFYFRLAQLAELSSFFSTLPPPSDSDLHDGTPMIPLHGASSLGLWIALEAIKSITSPTPFRLPPQYSAEYDRDEAVLLAAVIARKYDLSLVLRLMYEALVVHSDENEYGADRNPYLEFAVWAIGGVESMLAGAAARTIKLEGDFGVISCASHHISRLCREHAPQHWNQLVDLHLRHAQAIYRFRRELARLPKLHSPFRSHKLPGAGKCTEGEPRDVGDRVAMGLARAQSIEAVTGLRDECFGLECEICIDDAANRFGNLIDWIEEFSEEYILESDHF